MNFDQLVNLATHHPEVFRRVVTDDSSLVECRGIANETLLHYLCVENVPDAVEFLAKQGADPNVVNSIGYSPLMESAQLGSEMIVKVLLESGANPNFQASRDGNTAMHLAAEYENYAVLRELTAAGGDPNLTNNFGDTASSLAEENLH